MGGGGTPITPLLTAKQVGVMLSMSSRQVLRMLIPRVRLGPKTIRFRKEDVDAHVEKNTGH